MSTPDTRGSSAAGPVVSPEQVQGVSEPGETTGLSNGVPGKQPGEISRPTARGSRPALNSRTPLSAGNNTLRDQISVVHTRGTSRRATSVPIDNTKSIQNAETGDGEQTQPGNENGAPVRDEKVRTTNVRRRPARRVTSPPTPASSTSAPVTPENDTNASPARRRTEKATAPENLEEAAASDTQPIDAIRQTPRSPRTRTTVVTPARDFSDGGTAATETTYPSAAQAPAKTVRTPAEVLDGMTDNKDHTSTRTAVVVDFPAPAAEGEQRQLNSAEQRAETEFGFSTSENSVAEALVANAVTLELVNSPGLFHSARDNLFEPSLPYGKTNDEVQPTSGAGFYDVIGDIFGSRDIFNTKGSVAQLAMAIAVSNHPDVERIIRQGGPEMINKLRNAQVLAGMKILDLGCGDLPSFALAAKALGAEVHTVDISPLNEHFAEQLDSHIVLDLTDPQAASIIKKKTGGDFDFVGANILWKAPRDPEKLVYADGNVTKRIATQLVADGKWFFGELDLFQKPDQLPTDKDLVGEERKRNGITQADTIVIAERVEFHASHPTLTDAQREMLEQNRFVMTPESLEGMDKLQSTFQELQRRYPHLQGLGFFGSRKTGTEKPGSDYDIVIFYDSSHAKAADKLSHKQWMDITGILDQTLDGIELDYGIKDFIDISTQKTLQDLKTFIRIAKPFINKNITEDTLPDVFIEDAIDHLMYRFSLTGDDAVVLSRKAVLDYLKGIPHGEKYFRILMTIVSSFDRPSYGENASKTTLPRFTGFPKTIAEAQAYFVGNHSEADSVQISEAPQSRLEVIPFPRTGIYDKLQKPSYPYSPNGEITNEAFAGGGFMDILGKPFGSGEKVNTIGTVYQLAKAISISDHPEVDSILERGGPEMIQRLRDAQVLSGMKILDLGSGPFPHFALVAKALGAEVHTVDFYELDENLPLQLESHTVVNLKSPTAVDQIITNSGGNFTLVTHNDCYPFSGEDNQLWFGHFDEIRVIGEKLVAEGGYYYAMRDNLYQKIAVTPETETADQENQSADVIRLENTVATAETESLNPAERGAKELGFTTKEFPEIVTAASNLLNHPLSKAKIPAFVVLDDANQKRLKELFDEGIFPSYEVFGGVYDYKYNIVFLTPDSSEKSAVPIHETEHAVVNDINPEIDLAIEKLWEALVAHRKGELIDPPNVQSTVAGLIINEGIAYLGEFESVNPEEKEEQLIKLNLLLIGMGYNRPSPPDEKRIGAAFKQLATLMAITEQFLAERDPVEIQETQGETAVLSSSAIEIIGRYFFYKATEYLRSEGFQDAALGEKLKEIINNPPSSLAELRNPKAYVKKLLTKLVEGDRTDSEDETIGSRLPDFFPQLHKEFFAALLRGEHFNPTDEQIATAVDEHFAYRPLTPLTQQQEDNLRTNVRKRYENIFRNTDKNTMWRLLSEALEGNVYYIPPYEDHPMRRPSGVFRYGLFFGEKADELAEQYWIQPLTRQETERLLTDFLWYGEEAEITDGKRSTPLIANGTRHLTIEQLKEFGIDEDAALVSDTYQLSMDQFLEMLSKIRSFHASPANAPLRGLDIGGSNGLGAYDAEALDPNLEMTNITLDSDLAMWSLRGGHRMLQAERLPAEMAGQYDLVLSNRTTEYTRYPTLALENALRVLREGGILYMDFNSPSKLQESSSLREEAIRELDAQFRLLESLQEQGVITFLPLEDEDSDAYQLWKKGWKDIVGTIYLQKTGSMKELENAAATEELAAPVVEVDKPLTERLKEVLSTLDGELPNNPFLSDAVRHVNQLLKDTDSHRKASEQSRNLLVDDIAVAFGEFAVATGNTELADHIFHLLSPAQKWLLYATAYTADKRDPDQLDKWHWELRINNETSRSTDPLVKAARCVAIVEVEIYNNQMNNNIEALNRAVEYIDVFKKITDAIAHTAYLSSEQTRVSQAKNVYRQRIMKAFGEIGYWIEVEDLLSDDEKFECSLIQKALAGKLKNPDLDSFHPLSPKRDVLNWINDRQRGGTAEKPALEKLGFSTPARLLLETSAPELIGQPGWWQATDILGILQTYLLTGADAKAYRFYKNLDHGKERLKASLLMARHHEKKRAEAKAAGIIEPEQLHKALELLQVGETDNPYLADAADFATKLVTKAEAIVDPADRAEEMRNIALTLGEHAVATGNTELADRIFALLPPAQKWLLYATAYTADTDKRNPDQLADWLWQLDLNDETSERSTDPLVKAARLVARVEIELYNNRFNEDVYSQYRAFAFKYEFKKMTDALANTDSNEKTRITQRAYKYRIMKAFAEIGLWRGVEDLLSSDTEKLESRLAQKALAGELKKADGKDLQRLGNAKSAVLKWINDHRRGVNPDELTIAAVTFSHPIRILLEASVPELIEKLKGWPGTPRGLLQEWLENGKDRKEFEPDGMVMLKTELLMARRHEQKRIEAEAVINPEQIYAALEHLQVGDTSNLYLADAAGFAKQLIIKAESIDDPAARKQEMRNIALTLGEHAVTTGNSRLADAIFALLSPADRWLLYATADKYMRDTQQFSNWGVFLDSTKAIFETMDPTVTVARLLALTEIALHNYSSKKDRSSLNQVMSNKKAFQKELNAPSIITALDTETEQEYTNRLRIAFATAGIWNKVGDLEPRLGYNNGDIELAIKALAGKLKINTRVRLVVGGELADALLWINAYQNGSAVEPPQIQGNPFYKPTRKLLEEVAPKVMGLLGIKPTSDLNKLRIQLALEKFEMAEITFNGMAGVITTLDTLRASLLLSQHVGDLKAASPVHKMYDEDFLREIKPLEEYVSECLEKGNEPDQGKLREELPKLYNMVTSGKQDPQRTILAQARLAHLYHLIESDSPPEDNQESWGTGITLDDWIGEKWKTFELREGYTERLAPLRAELSKCGYTFSRCWKPYNRSGYIGYKPIRLYHSDRLSTDFKSPEEIALWEQTARALNQLFGEKRYIVNPDTVSDTRGRQGVFLSGPGIRYFRFAEFGKAMDYIKSGKDLSAMPELSERLEAAMSEVVVPNASVLYVINPKKSRTLWEPKEIYTNPDATLRYFEPVDPKAPVKRDRFGNRLIPSQTKAYKDRDGQETKAAMLVSQEGEKFIAENPGILTIIDHGLQQLEENTQVDLGNNVKMTKFLTQGLSSITYLLEIGSEKYTIQRHAPQKDFHRDFTQPYFNEMLQTQIVAVDFKDKLTEDGIEMPTFMFASGQMSCVKFEDGSHPTWEEMVTHVRDIEPLLQEYVEKQRTRSPLWNKIRLDPTPLNFIKRDGKLVWIDPFEYDPMFDIENYMIVD